MPMKGSIMNFVHKPIELPTGEHWAIIAGSSASIPGDQRSRECPGHGYPDHTVEYITYEAFTNEEEFKTELAARLESSAKFFHEDIRGIHVTNTYTGKTTIMVEENR
jgi:hypothetical protein